MVVLILLYESYTAIETLNKVAMNLSAGYSKGKTRRDIFYAQKVQRNS